jgi:uncharacterized protein YaiI (UPF0178 family)
MLRIGPQKLCKGRGVSNIVRIFVDADACPVKNTIISVAKRFKIPVTMVIDTSHILQDDYCEIITVDKFRDSVDLAIINRVTDKDIVVTQDFGLAALVLGKRAKAINQNGLVFSADNMDRLLFERFISQKVRRSGGRTKGPAKRTKEDDEKFERAFIKEIT